ncbi:hypothetical protein [Cognatiyoonia sp. IB215182]|uniref:hypothetical protein n=1 Tax=Cognatiyoonia sp. IB215182 TaxID=3097353 RepID=UPI002A0ACE5E|nr:hypothetical protein [Cognatiyoonia sp. IB215182]MDX8351823.1 hypothetical protein [Cognatiyoonia sp. IB215182]
MELNGQVATATQSAWKAFLDDDLSIKAVGSKIGDAEPTVIKVTVYGLLPRQKGGADRQRL